MSLTKIFSLVGVGGFLCVLALGVSANSAEALTITYIPDAGDSAMTYAAPSSGTANCCGAVDANLSTGRGGTATYSGRAVFRFDELATLDEEATITSATLRLFRSSTPEANDGLQRLFVLNSSFTTAGLNLGCCDSTTANGDLWRLADGVAGAGSTMGTPFATFTAVAGYNNFNVTSIVQNWQANNWTNAYGFGLTGVENLSASGVTYAGAFSANPMQLVLEYTVPVPAPEPSTLLLASACLACGSLRRRAKPVELRTNE